MQGEFRGDFTRDTFDLKKHFSRVLMQQGRVQLDADWNEQTSILLHHLRSLAADLIGPHATPDGGFEITGSSPANRDFLIGEGKYYVNGLLCENKNLKDGNGNAIDVTYFSQPDYRRDMENNKLPSGALLVYLDVWERHVTYVEDADKNNDSPGIREVALGGPDTSSRSKVVWQVKTVIAPAGTTAGNMKTDYDKFLIALGASIQPGKGQLMARAKKPSITDDSCNISPEARYRGVENQLYRVEIHKAGSAWSGKPGADGKPDNTAATFKWSRENGSVAFPIRKLVPGDGSSVSVTLTGLGRDSRLSLNEGDWVEIVDDDYTLRNLPEPLLKVTSVDRDESAVMLNGKYTSSFGQDAAKHPLLRRWDHKEGDGKQGGLTLTDGTAAVVEGSASAENWLTLEDGVQIQFQAGGLYQTGDYWLIPARIATGDVEWPGSVDHPAFLEAHGVNHHYAPLSIINVDPATGNVSLPAASDCRRKLKVLWA
jgi:hypothetical protein